MPYKAKVTDTMAWSDIPTCKEQGLDVDYLMLRGIFMPGGVTPDQVQYYVDLLKKVQATPDWKDFMEKGAFNPPLAGRQGVRRLGARARRGAAHRTHEGCGGPRY